MEAPSEGHFGPFQREHRYIPDHGPLEGLEGSSRDLGR